MIHERSGSMPAPSTNRRGDEGFLNRPCDHGNPSGSRSAKITYKRRNLGLWGSRDDQGRDAARQLRAARTLISEYRRPGLRPTSVLRASTIAFKVDRLRLDYVSGGLLDRVAPGGAPVLRAKETAP